MGVTQTREAAVWSLSVEERGYAGLSLRTQKVSIFK
jgi:hypothetical protein